MRVRRKIFGAADRPRISVYKSNRHLYVQVIDDQNGHTLTEASSAGGETKGLRVCVESGEKLGESLGKKMKNLGLEQAVYDRNGHRYHGVVKAIAEGVRKSGVQV